MFKVGDLVEVHNPTLPYSSYKDRVGSITVIPNGDHEYYHVRFSDEQFDTDAFNGFEIRLAKNRIILDILNDL